MGLLSTLKSLFGMEERDRSGSDVNVTVEREAGDREDADKAEAGTATADPSADVADTAEGDAETETAETETAETDAETDTEPTTETETAETEPTTETETAETEPTTETETAESDAETDETETDESEQAGPAAEAVDTIKGIGPAYAERLSDVGVETVGDLAAADPGEVAAETDLSETRVAGWVERAQVRVR